MTMFENMHIFNADMLGAKLQHRTYVVTAQRVRFISAPLILTFGAKLQHRTYVVTAQRVRFISAPLILTFEED